MTLTEYETITGIDVSASRETFVTAQIGRSQRILEDMLGFTLDPTLYNQNQYTESGKTALDCPCPGSEGTLEAADAVVFAYRLYQYNPKDAFLSIDPCSTVHAVKLVYNNITYKTLDSDEYRPETLEGMIKYLEQIKCWCSAICLCKYVQLAVDATWLWADGQIPADLNDVWAEMATFYSDKKKDLKSETLDTHKWIKAHNTPPEQQPHNVAVINKYAGPLGSIKRYPTI